MYLNKTALENNESIVNNKAYIDHITVPTQYDYAITSDSAADNNNTKEGEEITFTITRTKTGGSDAPTTILINIFQEQLITRIIPLSKQLPLTLERKRSRKQLKLKQN